MGKENDCIEKVQTIINLKNDISTIDLKQSNCSQFAELKVEMNRLVKKLQKQADEQRQLEIENKTMQGEVNRLKSASEKRNKNFIEIIHKPDSKLDRDLTLNLENELKRSAKLKE